MTANMHITVAGKQVDTGEALRTHVEYGLTTIAGKYFDHAMEARVTFSKVRSFFSCDINFHAGRNLTMRGEGQAADAHRAFDQAAEHVGKRLRRYRRRMNEHSRGQAMERMPQETTREYRLREEVEDHAEEIRDATHAAVVAEPPTEILRLTVGDAIFFDILRTYYQRYQNGNASTADFMAVAEEVSGQDLRDFFDAWLFAEAVPAKPLRK